MRLLSWWRQRRGNWKIRISINEKNIDQLLIEAWFCFDYLFLDQGANLFQNNFATKFKKDHTRNVVGARASQWLDCISILVLIFIKSTILIYRKGQFKRLSDFCLNSYFPIFIFETQKVFASIFCSMNQNLFKVNHNWCTIGWNRLLMIQSQI